MADRPVFLYAAIYDEIADAEADYEAVFDLHARRRDRNLRLRRDPKGRGRQGPRHEDREADPARRLDRRRRWGLGRDHLPARDHRRAVVGAGAGGLIGHLRGGISRDDLKELGDELEAGSAAVIVIGESKIEEQLEKATTRANKLIEKQIDADADELKREIDAAAKEDAK